MSDPRYQIDVSVTTRYLAAQSQPELGRYAFSYTVTIRNQGQLPAKLLSRHWIITDGDGRVQEVRGAGVVGEEPVLAPGESFEYTSGVPLPTPSGFMAGRYGMVTDKGESFEIEVPAFSLDSPQVGRTIN
jgi:ApaG protein